MDRLQVYFTSDEERALYRRLVADAEANKRSLSAQALFIIQQAYTRDDPASSDKSGPPASATNLAGDPN